MKNILFFLLILLLSNYTYAINEYPGELVGVINRGKAPNEIGWSRSPPPNEYFTFAPNGNILAPDAP